MLPHNYLDEANAKQQNFEREIRQQQLVKQALNRPENRASHHDNLLARFGSWLVTRGEHLKARFSLSEPSIIPTKSTVKAR